MIIYHSTYQGRAGEVIDHGDDVYEVHIGHVSIESGVWCILYTHATIWTDLTSAIESVNTYV